MLNVILMAKSYFGVLLISWQSRSLCRCWCGWSYDKVILLIVLDLLSGNAPKYIIHRKDKSKIRCPLSLVIKIYLYLIIISMVLKGFINNRNPKASYLGCHHHHTWAPAQNKNHAVFVTLRSINWSQNSGSDHVYLSPMPRHYLSGMVLVRQIDLANRSSRARFGSTHFRSDPYSAY